MSLVAAAVMAAATVPAMAQGEAVHTLVKVTARDVAAGQTEVLLEFSGTSPEARLGGEDGVNVSVFLLATARGNSARYDPAGSALLRDVTFQNERGGLRVNFLAATRIHLEMAVEGTQRFRVRLSARGPLPTAGPRPVADSGPVSSTLRKAFHPPEGENNFELIPLKYADVSEVVGLLTDGVTVRSNDVFTPREPGFGSPGANSNNPAQVAAQQQPLDQPLGQAVDAGLAIDRRLNAIFVHGTKEYIAHIKAAIAAIDVPLASVVLETQFVELSEQGARNVGIDFSNANGQIGLAAVDAGKYIGLGYVPNGNGRLSSASLQAAVFAQVQKGEGRIVSRPRIAAQSGSTAKIITGDALPILTAITLSGVNGVSQQVQYVNVGVTLQIAPRVSEDGYVSSHVFCVVSSVTGYSQGFPTISQREAETSATVRDGDAFVIGGLVQDNELKSKAKIPGLGDIPVLGRAFSVDKNTRSKTELYIIITPRIVRGGTRPAELDKLPAGAQASDGPPAP